jgi:hypothetical protein
MPIVLSAVFYFLAEAVLASGTAGVIAAAAGFVLSFAGISAVERSKKKSLPDIVIADIVERPENNGI